MKTNLFKKSTEPLKITKVDYYRICIIWVNRKDSKRNKRSPFFPTDLLIDAHSFESSNTIQVISLALGRLCFISNLSNDISKKLIKTLESIGLDYNKKFNEVEEVEIEYVSEFGQHFKVEFTDEYSESEILNLLSDSLNNSDIDPNFTPLDMYDIIISDEDDEDEEDDVEEDNEESNKLQEFNKDSVKFYIENNIPDLDLYETTNGTVFGGFYGQDSLEIREDHIFIFRGKKSLYYKDIKDQKDIKNFINKYL